MYTFSVFGHAILTWGGIMWHMVWSSLCLSDEERLKVLVWTL